MCAAAGGLLAGVVLDTVICRLPAKLFPELRAMPGAPQVWPTRLPDGRSSRRIQAWRVSQTARPTQLPLVMLLSALIAGWATSRFGPGWPAAIHVAWFYGLVVLAGIDLRHYLLPDALTIGLLALALAASATGFSGVGPMNAAGGAIGGFSVLWCLNAGYRRLRKIDGFGGGDLKLMAAIGAWVGMVGTIDVLTIASLLALSCAVALALLKGGRISLQSRLPFGPFLAAAVALVIV